ncbi:TolC family protein [Candidatus Nitrospira nitrificans]|nr:TolC family protein [Candidatus Nitrospira nitrificans]
MAEITMFPHVRIGAGRTVRWAAMALVALFSLSGCLIKPHALNKEDVKARMVKDFQAISSVEEPVVGPISLYEAVARALKYNLDAKVKTIQVQLAHQQLNIAHYSLLPQLSANAGFDGRNNFAGGVGQSIVTGRQAVEPFTSAEKNIVSGNLALSWDVLDFGLSFVRAQQAADNVMIAEEEKRRIAVRLVQEVRSAYWRAVSAERVLPRIQFLNESVTKALTSAQRIVDQKLQAPLTPLNYQRDLLNTQREVRRLFREFSTAKTQLASMMGLPPGTPFDLVIPPRETVVPVINLDSEKMEEQALMLRPELRAIDYKKRINAKEVKAVFLELFPSLKVSFGGYYNSNSFLFYQNWLTYAAQVSWNLLSVFRTPAKLKAIEAHGHMLDAQSMALSLSILTEVHVGAAQFVHAKEEYQDARNYQRTQAAIVEHTKNMWITQRTNDLTLIREQVNDVAADVRLDAARSGLETAYATLMASLGEEAVPAAPGEQSLAQLADSIRQYWEPSGFTMSEEERSSAGHAIPVAQ